MGQRAAQEEEGRACKEIKNCQMQNRHGQTRRFCCTAGYMKLAVFINDLLESRKELKCSYSLLA